MDVVVVDGAGRFFQGLPARTGTLPAPQMGYRPLNAGLVDLQLQKADNAVAFTSTMDGGLNVVGEGLLEIASRSQEFDLASANAIAQLFPDSAPGPDGAR